MAILAASAAFAQAADPKPSFDVASVKPVATGGREGGGRMGMGMNGLLRGNVQVTPSGLTMRGATLKNAIRWAYEVSEYQVSGPDWLDTARFDVAAKSPGPATEDQLRLMMQTLLADRFKLEFHRLSKEFSVYVLVPSKSGAKLQESKTEGDASVQPDQGKMAVTVQRMPVSQIIDLMTPMMGAPVIDRSGLKGKYDLTINLGKYVAEVQSAGSTAPPDPVSLIMSVLENEAGLKLEKQKIPLDVLVVDHAEKNPTEN